MPKFHKMENHPALFFTGRKPFGPLDTFLIQQPTVQEKYDDNFTNLLSTRSMQYLNEPITEQNKTEQYGYF